MKHNNWIDETKEYLENGYKKRFEYRELFIRVEKDKNDSMAYVMNDGWGIGSFLSRANTQEEFIQECKEYFEKNNI
jgi:hypothetical protein